MDAITIDAQDREVGKKATRSVRLAGNVPCILYGHHTDPVAFQVPELELKQLIYTSETHVVNISLGGKKYNCIMKTADFHPVTDRTIHADFQVLEKGERITLTIPVQFHGTPIGQKEGGDTQIVLHELEARCLPANIPSHVDVDISELAIGDAIHIGDIEMEGVEWLGRETQTVVTVVPPRVLEVEEEAELALAEAELAAEGEEGEEGAEESESEGEEE